MSGHTEGPWVIDCETRGGEICTIHSLPDGFGNGQGWTYIYGESRYPDGTEQVANARLIVASPLLLAACKAAASALDKLASTASAIGIEGTSDWDHLAGGADLFGVRDTLRAAIAKAEQP